MTLGISLHLWLSVAPSIKQGHGVKIRGSLTLVCDGFIRFQKRQYLEFFTKLNLFGYYALLSFFFFMGG